METNGTETFYGFVDPRSRNLMAQYNLRPREIALGYTELESESRANGGGLEVYVGTPVPVIERYIHDLACAAVLSYELTKRESVLLPISEDESEDFHRGKSCNFYDNLGREYEKLIEHFSIKERVFHPELD